MSYPRDLTRVNTSEKEKESLEAKKRRRRHSEEEKQSCSKHRLSTRSGLVRVQPKISRDTKRFVKRPQLFLTESRTHIVEEVSYRKSIFRGFCFP